MELDENLSKGERTRQSVIDAAYQLFLEQGYSATSMRQIAEKAGIALGGIYNHFASKDAIFQALIIDKHPFLQILPVLQRAPGATTEEFVRNAARLAQQELGEHPEFIRLMFIEVVEFNGVHFSKMLDTILPLALPLVQRFANPAFGLRANVALPKMMRAFLGNILGYYLTEILTADVSILPGLRDMSLEDFLEFFLYGILDNQVGLPSTTTE